tara:strand:- start:95 stop:820 length:726 start_codon:yes stop_codon:yes gene_type:complete
MSSIYRKGRDNYFYYQSYVFNKETGKKDKRVFVALKTKDEKVAKEKQLVLDKKYEKKTDSNYVSNYRYLSISLLFIILVSILIINLFPKNKSNTALSVNYGYENNLDQISDSTNSELLNIPRQENNILSQPDTEVGIKIPKFKILSSEELSRTFSQVKVSAAIFDKTNIRSMEEVCKIIAADFSHFDNIIVLLHNINDSLNGKLSNFQLNNENWIAMYTYNEVEGAIFNENPNGIRKIINK